MSTVLDTISHLRHILYFFPELICSVLLQIPHQRTLTIKPRLAAGDGIHILIQLIQMLLVFRDLVLQCLQLLHLPLTNVVALLALLALGERIAAPTTPSSAKPFVLLNIVE